MNEIAKTPVTIQRFLTSRTSATDNAMVSRGSRVITRKKGFTKVTPRQSNNCMSTMEQVINNTTIWSEDRPLNDEEFKSITVVGHSLFASGALPCTSCRYCVSHCPMGLDIPHLISLYNEFSYSGRGFIVSMNIGVLPEDKRPSACIGCHSCVAVCPQQLPIPETFAKFAEGLARKKK